MIVPLDTLEFATMSAPSVNGIERFKLRPNDTLAE
jgi:hypothetical protein